MYLRLRKTNKFLHRYFPLFLFFLLLQYFRYNLSRYNKKKGLAILFHFVQTISHWNLIFMIPKTEIKNYDSRNYKRSRTD